ncbi:MAG: hypothetical protein ACREOL_03705 [Candidatus Dormibacteria bacterium]
MTASERTPQERFRAFAVALDEEVVRPARRYLRGLRRGVVLGVILGVLCAPLAGRESRERLLRPWRALTGRRR